MKKLIVSLFLAVLLLSPVSVKAETQEEMILAIKEQIAIILQQIIGLQTQLLAMIQEQQAMAVGSANLQETVIQQEQTIQQVQQDVQQIVQNTTPPPPPPVKGCMDSQAKNYNSLAVEDDRSCVLELQVSCSGVFKDRVLEVQNDDNTLSTIIRKNEDIEWIAIASGGVGNYKYHWAGSNFKGDGINVPCGGATMQGDTVLSISQKCFSSRFSSLSTVLAHGNGFNYSVLKDLNSLMRVFVQSGNEVKSIKCLGPNPADF